MLKYFYITNRPEVALIAQSCGVERIFVDMEYIGKEERQPNLDTVKNHHTVDDVKKIRKVVTSSELLVRVNPLYEKSKEEIDSVTDAGADVVMLPMWRNKEDVKNFVSLVDSRAKTLLLLETDEAVKNLDEVLTVGGIDEIHIGLNDLHLSMGKKFMFELLTDGTVDKIVKKLKSAGIPYGIGGVGAVGGDDPLPAENILCEHYRLGSSMAILARAFCNADKIDDLNVIEKEFKAGIKANRDYERMLETEDSSFFEEKHKETQNIINSILQSTES